MRKSLTCYNMQQKGQNVCTYVTDTEGWKCMVVNKLVYARGSLAWYPHESGDFEVIQNGIGRGL